MADAMPTCQRREVPGTPNNSLDLRNLAKWGYHAVLQILAPDRISWGGSMRLRPTQCLLSIVLLAGSLANELNAQTTTSGGLTGVVTDQSQAVVPNADVE